ncbi:MAG: MobA/MobL family protein [Brasilonema angustatum HA4187-MV1]|jgi:hypothetical protein|nr:MobA/MobL family protein [Brasilonema angustatum HA4187-MV1]
MVNKSLHFGTSVISRSKSKPDNAVAACAYRSGKNLHDEKLDKTHNYSNKKGIISAEIFAPENAPDWMHENNWSRFGNEIEKAEDGHNRRNSAVLAKDFQVAAPRELSREQNWQLAQEFSKKINSRGLAVATAYHETKASDGKDNPHFHFMVPMREVDENGFGKRYRKLDGVRKGQKADPTRYGEQSEMMKLRREYYQCVNKALKEAGIKDVYYSPEKQEGKKPHWHKGKNQAALEKQGVKTRVIKHNERVDIDNTLEERYGRVKQDWEEAGYWSKSGEWKNYEKYRLQYQLNRGSAMATRDASQKTQSNVATPPVNRSEKATERAREQAKLGARQSHSYQERVRHKEDWDRSR